MTLLCGGLHNESRVPEIRLPAGNASVGRLKSGKQSNCTGVWPERSSHALFSPRRESTPQPVGLRFAFAQLRLSRLNRAAKTALQSLFASARKSCAIEFTAKVFSFR